MRPSYTLFLIDQTETDLNEAISDIKHIWKHRNKPTKHFPYPRSLIRFNVRRIRELRNELQDLRLQQP